MPITKREQGYYELTFWGGIHTRYRRWHRTFGDALRTAHKKLDSLDNRAAHPAIIYGPGLGKDGITVP